MSNDCSSRNISKKKDSHGPNSTTLHKLQFRELFIFFIIIKKA